MKLDGLRVLDLSVYLPGPYLTLALADHGAEVIKIEQPGEGDPARRIGLADGPSTVFFRSVNRGKKSVVLNLKDPAQRDALLGLAETADIFVESFRPGVVDRLGVGYEMVRARNPGIIYCSLSAFGQDSPYRDRPAHDLGVEAVSGVLGVGLGSDGYPAMPGLPLADLLAGLNGLAGVLMALYRRRSTGRGDYLDMAMHDATIAAMPNILGPVFAAGRQPVPGAERTNGGAAFYRIYETSDGRQLVLGGQEPKFIRALLDTFERPDLVPLCLAGPGPHQEPVVELLRSRFAEQTLAYWLDWLAQLDLCFAPVNTLPEAFADPNVQARRMAAPDAQGRPTLASPIKFRDEPARPPEREPALGEHTDEILGSIRTW